jgi:hypothetical protein
MGTRADQYCCSRLTPSPAPPTHSLSGALVHPRATAATPLGTTPFNNQRPSTSSSASSSIPSADVIPLLLHLRYSTTPPTQHPLALSRRFQRQHLLAKSFLPLLAFIRSGRASGKIGLSFFGSAYQGRRSTACVRSHIGVALYLYYNSVDMQTGRH